MELQWWPPFGIRVRTPRLELRPLNDGDLDELCELIAAGIHPPEEMPFMFPWTRQEPPALQRSSLQFHWRARAEWTDTHWQLCFGVHEDGRLVGQQDVIADQFGTLRTVKTGSWLGQAHQGRGIGTEMRAAVLHFAFAGLGAERAETDAFVDNPASLGVTTKLGYEPNGELLHVRDGQPAATKLFVLHRARWEARRRDDVTIEGLDEARSMFGL